MRILRKYYICVILRFFWVWGGGGGFPLFLRGNVYSLRFLLCFSDFSIIEAPSAKKLGFSEESMAVSPSIMKTSPKVSHLANSNSVQGTPKKLRFAMEEDEDTEQESPKKESLVSSAKKLRFSDKGAKASAIRAPGSPTSSKSVLTRTPIRPLKERSPTPERLLNVDSHSPFFLTCNDI